MNERRAALEDQVFELLSNGCFEQAARVVLHYELQSNDRSGFGTPWHWPGYQSDFVEDAVLIARIKPKILGDLSEEVWRDLRIRAAMWHLLGRGPAAKRHPLSRELVGGRKPEHAANMIKFAVSGRRSMIGWAKSGVVSRVEILSAKDCCQECAAIPYGPYPIADSPELPHPACTGKYGCRCMTSAIVD